MIDFPLVNAFFAPLCAVSSDDPSVLHGVTMEGIFDAAKVQGQFVSPCWKTVRILVVSYAGRDERRLALWPPRASGPQQRCRVCYERIPQKRMRLSKLDPVVDATSQDERNRA